MCSFQSSRVSLALRGSRALLASKTASMWVSAYPVWYRNVWVIRVISCCRTKLFLVQILRSACASRTETVCGDVGCLSIVVVLSRLVTLGTSELSMSSAIAGRTSIGSYPLSILYYSLLPSSICCCRYNLILHPFHNNQLEWHCIA